MRPPSRKRNVARSVYLPGRNVKVGVACEGFHSTGLNATAAMAEKIPPPIGRLLRARERVDRADRDLADARDAFLAELERAVQETSRAKVADALGVSRQRVQQLLRARK